MTFSFEGAAEDRAEPSPGIVSPFSLVAMMLLIMAWASGGLIAQTPSSTPLRRVLVLYSDERLLPATIIGDEAIRAAFAAGTSSRVEFHSEFLDVSRFPGEAQQQRQRDFLRDKYRERPPDLVIAAGGPALEFLLKYRATLFADVPIVYCSVPAEALPKEMPDAKIVGIPILRSAVSTLELALLLQPGTRNVAVVAGSTPRDLESAEQFRRETPTFKDRVGFTWLTNLSLPNLRDELSRLPDHTVVLYLTMFQDATGAYFTPRQALALFAPASRAPIYGYYDTYLGYGIVGGSMVTFEEIGRKAAQLGIRILAGEDAQAAARSEPPKAVPMFDWRELRRWNISEKRLPPGSVVRFRETTYWKEHRWLIFGVVAACIVEGVLIAVLLVQLRRRRVAEASLRESEERVNLATASAGVGLWATDLSNGKIWLTDRTRQLFGLSPDEAPSWDNFLSAIHPGDRERVSQSVNEALLTRKEFVVEFSVVGADGSSRWISSRGRAHFGSNAKPERLMGASVDITERKRAEEDARHHFKELAHIARVSLVGELSGSLVHELGQPLGAIMANTEAAEMHLARANPNLDEVRAILVDVRSDTVRAGEVVRGMRAFLRRYELDFKQVDLRSLMSEVEKLARPDAAARRATLDFYVAANLPPVWGHHVQLQQVLLNLILNGLEAMNGNSQAEQRLSVGAAARDGSFVEIAVSDTGPGLPMDKLEQVFAPFITSKATGLGMGLSICRRIIEAHGGKIRIENNADRGATARFTLPIMSVGPS